MKGKAKEARDRLLDACQNTVALIQDLERKVTVLEWEGESRGKVLDEPLDVGYLVEWREPERGKVPSYGRIIGSEDRQGLTFFTVRWVSGVDTIIESGQLAHFVPKV